MSQRDPRCVFVADSLGLAKTVAVYLGQHGVAAEVMNPMTLGGPDNLSGLPTAGVSADGIEVWINDPAQATRAQELLADQKAFKGTKLTPAVVRTGTVDAVCDECGKTTTFPAAVMDSVQNCSHCGAYMDIPDPDSDWDEADIGDEEAEPE